MTVFEQKGYQIYVVGGGLRDFLLAKETNNWDFTTNALPENILQIFPDGFYHNKYGTVTVRINDELYEVTPFRKESQYLDYRHPEKIEWADAIEEDLSRRDFTVNAMAYDGKRLIDLFEGRKHLREKLIVAVGDPDIRFTEDALRLLRAIRFSAQLGFSIEGKTQDSIKKNSALITKIAWERIRDELIKILSSGHPAKAIFLMHETELLKYILPELDQSFLIPQKSPKRHHIYDAGTHMVMSLKHCPSKNPITRLAALLHDVGKAATFHKDAQSGLITFYNHEVVGERIAKEIAQRLKLSNKDKNKFVKLVKYHQFTVSEIITDKVVRRFIREIGKENIQDMLDLRTGDRIGSGAAPTSWRFELFKKRLIDVQKEPFKITDLKIDGNDIMKKLSLKPGPKVGIVLKQIFQQVVEKKLANDRKTLLNYLQTLH